ncbi:glycosyltransferase family 4 protein [Flavobacterium frigidarium]|uniref:Glycosyltransferase family 4 protein n=1 Tax=Flavobacterium frigidarium TaxID=99286 RepID=A0ABV4KBF2_9FLAO
MKKILIINNTIFYEKNEELFLNKETGHFVIDLRDFGNSVSVFQISQPKRARDSFANFSLSNKDISIYEVKRKGSRLYSFIKSFFVMQKAILKNDFVYIYYPGPICLVVALSCMIYKKPFGLYIRGEQGIDSMLSLKIIKRAMFIFTISPKFTENISFNNKDVNTIRPMISFNEGDVLKERILDFGKRVNILYVGRLVFDKGLFELIDAVKILKINNHNIHLNLVGDGIDKDKLQSKVKEEDLLNEVSFLGMISDKQELINIYRCNEVFVLPTYHEGFPRVLYEAMMMNIPIITTFVGTINYLMENERNCLELKVKDIGSIVTAVERLIKDPNLGQKFADQGRLTVMNYLGNKKVKHSELVNHLIQNNI